MSNKSFASRVREGVVTTALATSTMLGTSGCSESPKPAQPNAAQTSAANAKGNLFDLLSHYEFTGQDGQPVNTNALKAKLQNNPVTLTFGFAECENYCPMINHVLAKLDEVNPNLTNVIIAVNPEKDSQQPDVFMKRLQDDGIPAQNAVILYPKSGRDAVDIAVASGAIVNASKPLDHSAKVTLFGAGGQRLKEKSGLDSSKEFVSEWSDVLGGGPKR